MNLPWDWIAAWLLAVNLVAVCLTVADKRRARRGKWRVSESTLLLVAALGGAPAMLVTMRRIRHKTRHRKFMWGLPVILLAQAALVAWLLWRF